MRMIYPFSSTAFANILALASQQNDSTNFILSRRGSVPLTCLGSRLFSDRKSIIIHPGTEERTDLDTTHQRV
jgi:hypothetical protein